MKRPSVIPNRQPTLMLSDLIAHLQGIQREHGDIIVVCTCCSDYTDVRLSGIEVIELHKVHGAEWYMRHHADLPPGCKAVHFEGN